MNLLVGKQKPGVKGDTPDMLIARRRFFDAGYYEPLRQALAAKVKQLAHNTIAEVGCGEGYYLGGISEHISSATCWGTDIAKAGLRLAARRYPGVHWATADTNRQIPLPTGAVDVLLDVFAPRNAAEFARVVHTDGRLLVVIPTSRHLAELREVQRILAIEEQKREAVVRLLAGHFKLVSDEILAVPLDLDGAAIGDLIGMTPNAWFLKPEQRESLAAIKQLHVTAEFEILEFSRAH